ncbi:hypothetical protein Tsubulata_033959 [Turnera subulata]|uniref:F-box domain-containing protein n=1 Tax=Turnera subulata TaxID=218843 RepID=A0A9Q0J7V6_9ROSI|nr:hypothetical protein Tsubulata_033959 [Turnera subulata]
MASRRISRKWCDLPSELLNHIAGSLETQCDLRRFRSVCRSWRNSTLPPPPPKPSRTIYLPPFWDDGKDEYSPKIELKETSVYCIESLPSTTHHHHQEGAAAAAARPWFVRLRFTESGTAVHEDLATGHPVLKETHKRELRKVLDLRDFQVREICKAYHLWVESDEYFIVSYCFVETEDGSLMGMVLGDKVTYSLFWKMGDDHWTGIDITQDGTLLDELVGYHKGRFFVVSLSGLTHSVDPVSLEVNQVGVAAIQWFPGRKYLVGWSGDLFLVDKRGPEDFDEELDFEFEFKVRKLDEQQQEWVGGEDGLEDLVLFIAYGWSAFVPAKHLPGYGSRCVYYADVDFIDRCYHPASCFMVSEMGGGLHEALQLCPGSSCSNLFWPPPNWLDKNPLV